MNSFIKQFSSAERLEQTLKINSSRFLLILIFLTAFNGMLSEYLLGHLLSLSWGSVYRQYALSMGIFVASMGFGSWKFRNVKRPGTWLMRIQFLSASLLSLATLATWIQLEIHKNSALSLLQLLCIAGIGFFSGGELPLLEKLKIEPSGVSRALFYDYLGMAVGSLAFGFFLLQALGVFGTLSLSLLLHLILLGLFYCLNKESLRTS